MGRTEEPFGIEHDPVEGNAAFDPIEVDLGDGVTAKVWTSPNAADEIVTRSIEIVAPDGQVGRGVTGEHLRRISLASVHAQVREREKAAGQTVVEAGAITRAERPRVGRWSTIEDDELAQYAEWYLEAGVTGSSNPVQQMRERFEREGRTVSVSKIRDRLKACREYLWLVGSRQGHAGAVAGPSLRHWREVGPVAPDRAPDPTQGRARSVIGQALADTGVQPKVATTEEADALRSAGIEAEVVGDADEVTARVEIHEIDATPIKKPNGTSRAGKEPDPADGR